jgi:hypothetical protein
MNITQLNGKLYQKLTPRDFLILLKRNRGSIKKTRFIAPKLGSSSFGKILVEYNYEPTTQKSTAYTT